MAFTKKISFVFASFQTGSTEQDVFTATPLGTGQTVYAIIRRSSDKALLNDANGTFSALPADPHIALTEDATIKGFYEVDEKRSVWANGEYFEFFYNQLDASPAPSTDDLVGLRILSIHLDQITNLSTILTKITNVETLISNLRQNGNRNQVTLNGSINGVEESINSISDSIGKVGLDDRMKTRIGDI